MNDTKTLSGALTFSGLSNPSSSFHFKSVQREGVVAVLDVHRATLDVDRDMAALSIFARCPCGWESGREPHPQSASEDEQSRVILRFAIFHHIADMIFSEGMA